MKTKLTTRLLCFVLLSVMLFGCLAGCKDDPKEPDNDGNVEESSVEFVCATMCTAPSTTKVLQKQDYASGTQKLSFKAFRNEYENAQVIMTAKTDVLSYDVELGDLKSGENTLSKDCFSVYNEKYIVVSNQLEFLSGYGKGSYPDALLPLDVAIEYGENQFRQGLNQGLWFTVFVPEDQAAGVYTGKFALTINGETREFPVEVTVWDYVVPSATHQKSCFAVYDDALGKAEVSWTREMEELYTEMLLNYRLQPQSLPTGLGHAFNPSTKDLTDWIDSVVKYTKDERTTWFNIPYKIDNKEWTLPDGTAGQKGTLIDFELYKNTLVMLIKRSGQEGINLMEKMGMYLTLVDEADYNNRTKESAYLTKTLKTIQQELYDEYMGYLNAGEMASGGKHYIGNVDAAFIREMLTDMKNIQHWTTSAHTNVATNSNLIYEYPATQCIYLWQFHVEEWRDAIQAEIDRYNEFYGTDTGEVWMYTATAPVSPYPTLHLDDDLLTLRSMGWMMKQYNIIGQEYWYTTLYYYMENGWDNVMTGPLQDCYQTANRYAPTNGDGFIFYPGAPYGIKGPIASVRLEVLRDSMEDYEIFYVMEQMYKEIVEKNGGEYSYDEFASIIDLISTGYYSGTIVQIGDTLTDNFGSLREAMVTALDLLSMGVRVTDFEKNSAVISLTMDAPAGVTITVNGQALAAQNGKLVATVDLSGTNVATISATNGSKTVSGDFWLGMPYEAITADKIGNYLNVGASTAQFVANDASCGKDAYRVNLMSGTPDLVFNLKELNINNISQSLWLDIYNDSEQTMEFVVRIKKGNGNYNKVYEAYHLDETLTITLEPGMNHVEISGYALLSGERSPKKEPVSPDSLKLTASDLPAGIKIAITNMYVEKG